MFAAPVTKVWDEAAHPRDEIGRWTEKAGAADDGIETRPGHVGQTLGAYGAGGAALHLTARALRHVPGKVGAVARFTLPLIAAVPASVAGAVGGRLAGDPDLSEEERPSTAKEEMGRTWGGLAGSIGGGVLAGAIAGGGTFGAGAIPAAIVGESAGGYAGEELGALFGRYLDRVAATGRH